MMLDGANDARLRPSVPPWMRTATASRTRIPVSPMSRPPRTLAPDVDAAEAEEPDEGDAGGCPDPPRNADADEVGGGDGGEVAERSVEAELDGVVGETARAAPTPAGLPRPFAM
jgi:hypothetical protein